MPFLVWPGGAHFSLPSSEVHMFWYFLLTVAASAVLFILGVYSVQVSILFNFFKIAILVAIFAVLIYVYKKLSSRRKSRLLPRSDDG
jgi:hypothetical protein